MTILLAATHKTERGDNDLCLSRSHGGSDDDDDDGDKKLVRKDRAAISEESSLNKTGTSRDLVYDVDCG